MRLCRLICLVSRGIVCSVVDNFMWEFNLLFWGLFHLSKMLD